MIDRGRPPKKRPGYRWEYRAGCDCDHCKGKSCIGRTMAHWIEVKEGPDLKQIPSVAEQPKIQAYKLVAQSGANRRSS